MSASKGWKAIHFTKFRPIDKDNDIRTLLLYCSEHGLNLIEKANWEVDMLERHPNAADRIEATHVCACAVHAREQAQDLLSSRIVNCCWLRIVSHGARSSGRGRPKLICLNNLLKDGAMTV